jgi:hypothetical protein
MRGMHVHQRERPLTARSRMCPRNAELSPEPDEGWATRRDALLAVAAAATEADAARANETTGTCA